MLERDRFYLSKYAIDPEIETNFDSYEIPDFHFETDIDSDLDNIELDGIDEDLWSDQYTLGRNPYTGEDLKVKATKAPKFTAGKALKEAVK